MPTVYCCPFYSWEEKHKVHCEGGVMNFLDAEAMREYISQYCAQNPGWKKCTVAQNLQNTYERVENDE